MAFMASPPRAAHARLVYVVGPSGSGKDSLLDYARARLPPGANIVFAQRTITRPAAAGGEAHAAVTQAQFDEQRAAGGFAMHWRANGLSYGIGREILDWLAEGRTVVVSGSRAHLPVALAGFPILEVVEIHASPEALRTRLAARGREDAERIRSRLARAEALALANDPAAIRIANDGRIEEAGNVLLGFLLQRAQPAAGGRV